MEWHALLKTKEMQDLQVRFSNGMSLTVAPKQVARRTSP
jgi:hypothetical protein